MGMYTCVRFVGVVKKEYLNDVKGLESWELFAQKHKFAVEYSKLQNCNSIPFGIFSAYNEDKFSGEEPHMNELVTYNRCWVFQCDLKNYDGEIDAFMKNIAPVICERFTAQVWYEEQDMCDVYYYKGNKVEFIKLGKIE